MYQSPIIEQNLNTVLAAARTRQVAQIELARVLGATMKQIDGVMLNKSILPRVVSLLPEGLRAYYYDGTLTIFGMVGTTDVPFREGYAANLKSHPERPKRFDYDVTWGYEAGRERSAQEMLDSIEHAQRNAPALVARYNAAFAEMSAATDAFGRAQHYIYDSHRVHS